MTEHITEEKRNRAVLVGLDAFSLSREENATEESMEELEALRAGGFAAVEVLGFLPPDDHTPLLRAVKAPLP